MISFACLICHQEIPPKANWSSLLLLKEENTCDDCYQSFKKVTGPTCTSCCRPQETNESCSDCKRWVENPLWKGILDKNISLFEYNDAMKEVLATFKFRGDAELVNVFRKDVEKIYKKQIQSMKFDYLIPIPLSKERLYERGFNQAKLLADFLPLPQLDILQRTDHEKQSKKSRHERITAENVFSVSETIKIIDKNILLIDDIYTTGTTLRHAGKLLMDSGAAKISSLTLIRS